MFYKLLSTFVERPLCCLAFHHILDVFKRKMFHWFLPNGTMLATRLAFCGRIYHQRTQLLMSRTDDVVEV